MHFVLFLIPCYGDNQISRGNWEKEMDLFFVGNMWPVRWLLFCLAYSWNWCLSWLRGFGWSSIDSCGMRFVNIRLFKHAIEPASQVNMTPNRLVRLLTQALTTALSATVGLGNIAGVAIAIGVMGGGPGATFWMIRSVF